MWSKDDSLCFASVFRCGRKICSVKPVEGTHVCVVYVPGLSMFFTICCLEGLLNMIRYDIYLLQLGFHPVELVGKLVQK